VTLTLAEPGGTGSLGAKSNLIIATGASPVNLGTVVNTQSGTTAVGLSGVSASVGDAIVLSVAMDVVSGTVSVADSTGNNYGTAVEDVTNSGDVRTLLFFAPVTTALNNGTV